MRRLGTELRKAVADMLVWRAFCLDPERFVQAEVALTCPRCGKRCRRYSGSKYGHGCERCYTETA